MTGGLPFRLTDPAGCRWWSRCRRFSPILLAAGRSEATIRSYGMDLLRWFRFLWAAGVPWNTAVRAEARDFCRWMQVAGKPARPHWRAPERRPVPRCGAAYAPSVRAHCETVLRCFYEFHLEAGTGPIVNPFPLDRSRRGRRRTRTTIRWSRYRQERAGLYRPAVPSRIPRSVPDEEFNEIFARLPSHRDRALVAFYVSTGARASELLSATQGGAHPGRQVITVIRKGTRELQELPGSTDAFVWLRLYQAGDGRADSRRVAAAAVVDIAAPGPAADLPRRAPHVRAGQPGGGQCGDAALAASHRGLPDG